MLVQHFVGRHCSSSTSYHGVTSTRFGFMAAVGTATACSPAPMERYVRVLRSVLSCGSFPRPQCQSCIPLSPHGAIHFGSVPTYWRCLLVFSKTRWSTGCSMPGTRANVPGSKTDVSVIKSLVEIEAVVRLTQPAVRESLRLLWAPEDSMFSDFMTSNVRLCRANFSQVDALRRIEVEEPPILDGGRNRRYSGRRRRHPFHGGTSGGGDHRGQGLHVIMMPEPQAVTDVILTAITAVT